MYLKSEACKKFDEDPEYMKIIVEYQGDFIDEISKIDDVCGRVINDRYGVVYVKQKDLMNLINNLNTITYFEFDSVYVLEDVSAISTAFIPQVQSGDYLKLNGEGTIVAILDTGINYLDEAFLDENGMSRIEYIFDKSIIDEKNNFEYGVVYSKEDINSAIKAKSEGKNPYEIVKSKDQYGHGTSMAAIVGGRLENRNIESVAYKCNYIIVKLKENIKAQKWFGTNNIIYSVSEILEGIQFIVEKSRILKKPLVIYIPLGSTEGSHTGNTVIEKYIDLISQTRGTVVVTGTGNQGIFGGHVNGKIHKPLDTQIIELLIGEKQRNIYFDIWVKKPSRVSLNVISPSGESTGILPITTRGTIESKFVFENTNLKVYYYWPDELTGDEIIRVVLEDLKPGIWRFKVRGDYILNGEFNAWLPPESILQEGTSFISSNPYLTMTIPGMSRYIIVNSWYNQNNNTINGYSGRGEQWIGYGQNTEPIMTVGGDKIKPIGKNSEIIYVSGSSASSAITAGACSLLLQWGIVDGNDKIINAQKMITYFMRGVRKRPGDVYPNPEWGYGKLDMLTLFQNIK
ncbi:S8 family peptidase [Clostridium chauvoei]|uniref:S8 family peptidase n=1 Tax=Clostridium chauvoei TaxID=46867 RepID=UPI001C8577EF|nr:S8 family peptidase [Clostridium chauvoei]MBX7312019.1 S8 family peptidase [Clostridium chauvoei]MBX7317057.1 S8 family peptidase [Clostridium chauvoei]MBX7344778.1 S8 family peptidase [Clostridium chauvoei]